MPMESSLILGGFDPPTFIRSMSRILLSFLCLLVAAPAAFAQPTVSAVRIGAPPDKTRFVMAMSERPQRCSLGIQLSTTRYVTQ